MGIARDCDVVVVGAGPAGAAAACFLADAGAKVVLLDRRQFPREKPCGEGILPQGVGVLERLDVLAPLVAAGARTFHGIRYHAPGGRIAVGPFPKAGHGLAVRRVVLDAELLKVATARPGVTFDDSFSVRDVLRDSRGRICGVTDGERQVRARLVVAADGTHSAVRRAAGLDGTPTQRQAVRMHFRPLYAPPADELVDVYVGGGSEAYVTPVAPGEFGVACLAEGPIPRSEEGPGSSAERSIRATLRGRGGIAELLADAPAVSVPMAATGVGAVATRDVADGLLLLGDAAGSPDPITGMGISFALRCASQLPAAVACAFASGDFSAERLRGWSRIRRREVTGGFVVTAGVLWMAARDRRAEMAVRALGRAPGLFTALFRLAS